MLRNFKQQFLQVIERTGRVQACAEVLARLFIREPLFRLPYVLAA